jgi:hypothetical protein
MPRPANDSEPHTPFSKDRRHERLERPHRHQPHFLEQRRPALETALSEGAEIGYQGFELGNKFPTDPQALKAKLADYGVACVWGGIPAAWPKARSPTRSRTASPI